MKTLALFLLSLALAMSGSQAQAQVQTQAADDGWLRVTAPRAWIFPRDHGSHPEFQSEWWYFTGNLVDTADSTGRPFGYQLTIFRQGITRHSAAGSAWATGDFYFAHFTISDLAGGKFHFFERLDRGALGQAGSLQDRMEAWVRDWRIDTLGDPKAETYRLQAGADEEGVPAKIDLTLHPLKPLVYEGPGGLSQKGEESGNASNYYSYPRLDTRGTLAVGGKSYAVSGLSWFDHEFSTSSLGAHEIGWDWFSLQLDSGEEVMLYLLRDDDGTIAATSSGTWVAVDGSKIDLHAADFQVEASAIWTSPHTGGRYPARWRIRIPKVGADLTVEPRLADQELVLHELGDLSYWEGASRVAGTAQGHAVAGTGYVELTGYAHPLMGRKP